MISNIIDKKAELLCELNVCADAMKVRVEAYISKFNADGILRLFEEQNDKKKYFERYTEFANKLSDDLGAFENSVAVVSMLVCQADQSCNTERTAYFASLFESCDTLLRSISNFFECNNKNFSPSGKFKVALTLSSASELKNAIEFFTTSINHK